MAHDPRLVKQMPPLIRSLLPFHLTARFGISDAMYRALRGYLELGNSIAGIHIQSACFGCLESGKKCGTSEKRFTLCLDLISGG